MDSPMSGVPHEENDTGLLESNSNGTLSSNDTKPNVNVSAMVVLTDFLNSTGPSMLGIPEFVCLGWHQTGECSPNGIREPENDVDCRANISAGTSGYCLLRDESTGEEVQAMRVNCTSLRHEVTFNCDQAVDFARVAPQIDALIKVMHEEENPDQIHDVEVDFEPKKGIVLVMYPKMLSSVYGTVRLLRSYECSLPIELWFLESEMGASPLQESPILQSLVSEYGPISLYGIREKNLAGFTTKIYAMAHSKLDQVLLLDADNTPVRDPTYLFTTPEFERAGAIFWPDFWHPSNTIFNIKAESLIWELIGLPFVDMFEQESGQLLIDRRRATIALEVVQLLALREPNHFELLNVLYGDKDLFRLAWLKTNTTFHMIGTPLAAAGIVNLNQFCGMTMVQHDPQGEVLFLHHNGKKLIGDDQLHTWTHLQSFVIPENFASMNADVTERASFLAKNYLVGIYGASAAFPGFSMCYRIQTDHYRLTPWEKLPWHDIENRLHAFVQEAKELGQ